MADDTFFRSNGCKVIVFFVGVGLLGAALAPPMFWVGKDVVARGWLAGGLFDSLHGSMERATFNRYFNRAILLAALLLLWPILRWMSRGDTRKMSWKERLDLSSNPYWKRHLVAGFLLAAGLLLILGRAYVGLGLYTTKEAPDPLFSILLSALGTGLAVGFLEEFVFRGALHAVMSKVLKPMALWLGIAGFFAIAHFLKPPPGVVFDEVTAMSGFRMLGLIFQQWGDLYFVAAEFAVLFAIGLVLGWTRIRTGSLWIGIGLHAGWVFGVKTLSPYTERNFSKAEMMPWLGDNLRVGVVSCLVVLLTWLIVWLWLRGFQRSDPEGKPDELDG